MTETESQSSDERLWESATWEGARREQLRRWAKLPLEKILKAQEEMNDLAHQLANSRNKRRQGIKK